MYTDLTYIQWFITNINDILLINLCPPYYNLNDNNNNNYNSLWHNMVPLPKIKVDILSQTDDNLSYTILERINAIPSCNPVFSLANADSFLWMNSLNHIDDFSRNIRINIIDMNKYNDDDETESIIKSWIINLDTVVLIGSPLLSLSDLGDLPLNSIFFTSERGQILTIKSQLDFIKQSLSSSSSSSEMKNSNSPKKPSKHKSVGMNDTESKKILDIILENEKSLVSILENVNKGTRSSSNVSDLYDDEGNLLLLKLKVKRDEIRKEVERLRASVKTKMQKVEEDTVVQESEVVDKESEIDESQSISESEPEAELGIESRSQDDAATIENDMENQRTEEQKVSKQKNVNYVKMKKDSNKSDSEDNTTDVDNNLFVQRQGYLEHLRATIKRETTLEANDITNFKAAEAKLKWWGDQLKEASNHCGDIAKEVVALKEKSKVAKLDFMRVEFLLEARRLKLLNSLQFIYPIEELDTVVEALKSKSPHQAAVLLHDRLSQASLRGSNSSQIDDRNSSSPSLSDICTEFTIRGLHIPTQYSLYTQTGGTNTTTADEDRISTALGYLAHFILLLAKYMGIPLRYPVYVQGSRSFISDPSLPPNQGLLPLFRKGSLRIADKAAVWLLRDVEQIIRSTGGAPNLVESKGPLGSIHDWILDNLYPEIEI